MMKNGKRWLLLLLVFFAFGMQAKTLRIGVLLPLKDQTSRGEKMLEFYRGFLLAADSLRAEGASIEIKAYHSGSSASEMDMLLATEDLTRCQMIVGPLDVSQIPRLTDYCQTHQIKLVVPFSSDTQQLERANQYCMVSANKYSIQHGAVWFLSHQFADYQEILVKTGELNEEGQAFVELVKKDVQERDKTLNVLSLPCDSAAISNVVDTLKQNIFILDASGQRALNMLIPVLKEFKMQRGDVDLCMFGYPQWQTYSTQFLQDFYFLNTYFYTSFYAHPLDVRHRMLETKYGSWFYTPMTLSFPCYSLMGFDIGYYFMKGFYQYGDAFDVTRDRVDVNPYQHSLWFERDNEESGARNTFVELVHYAPTQSIELIIRNR